MSKMSDAFASAAARHWEDAQRLFLDNRFDNAAYLAGYAVECSLNWFKLLAQLQSLWDPSWSRYPATPYYWPA